MIGYKILFSLKKKLGVRVSYLRASFLEKNVRKKMIQLKNTKFIIFMKNEATSEDGIYY